MAMAWPIMPPAEAATMPIAVIERGIDGTDYGHVRMPPRMAFC
jgi:hypothetical protein